MVLFPSTSENYFTYKVFLCIESSDAVHKPLLRFRSHHGYTSIGIAWVDYPHLLEDIMFKYLSMLVFFGLLPSAVFADDLPTSPVQEYLSSARFIDGEVALANRLDAHPDDDEARFGLGTIQFLRAIETVGQTMYEYGVDSRRVTDPIPDLPIPKNENPATASTPEFRRVLEVFVANLNRAEETLAKIVKRDVKLKLKLDQITFDFTKTGKEKISISEILKRMNAGQPLFRKSDQEIRIHFDRGDVAWLRAYCHLLAAGAEAWLSIDESQNFNNWARKAFPKFEVSPKKDDGLDQTAWVTVGDAPHLRRSRLHLLAVCELNRETWELIRQEKDDDFEWLSHPGQKDQLGIPVTDQQITAWLNAMQQVEQILKGESLLPGQIVNLVDTRCPKDHGLNIRKIFDDPPRDLLNYERITGKGINPKYLEPEAGKAKFDVQAFAQLLQLYNGPFGFAQAVRMN